MTNKHLDINSFFRDHLLFILVDFPPFLCVGSIIGIVSKNVVGRPNSDHSGRPICLYYKLILIFTGVGVGGSFNSLLWDKTADPLF